jgi:hypothetical protein
MQAAVQGCQPPSSMTRMAAGSRRRLQRWCLATAAALLLGLGLYANTYASGSSRAVVVVDTGSNVYKKVVSFSGSSINGLEALRLAGADPETVGYSGQGVAVCKLFGVGHDPTRSSCLGTPSDPRYWAYFRAPAGSTSFSYSSVGAGASTVRDGDVEGWKFGTGAPPPFYSFCEVAGCPDKGRPDTQTGGGVTGAGESPSLPGGGTADGTVAGSTGDGALAGGGGGASNEQNSGKESPVASSDGGVAAATGGDTTGTVAASDTANPLLYSEDKSRQIPSRGLGTLASAVAFASALVLILTAGLVARKRRRPPA